METIGVIYGVRLASSEEYRYVGLTRKTVSRRFHQHLRNAARGKKTPFYDWLRKRPVEDVVVDTLETVSTTLEDLGRAEVSWIAKLSERGDRLLNLSEGGLAAALVESSLRYGVGARIALEELMERDGVDLFTALFSETQARAIVSVPRSEEVRFKDMCTARGFAHLRIGVVDAAGGKLEINGVDELSLDALREAHEATLPKYFG